MDDDQRNGFWNTRPVTYSKETQNVLKELINEARVTNYQRRMINESVRDGRGLPNSIPPVSTAPTKTKKSQSASSMGKPKYLNPKNYSGGVRTKEQILASGAYEPPRFIPQPRPRDLTKDKERLAHMMAYGEDLEKVKKESLKRAAAAAAAAELEEPPREVDRFDELVQEVEERRQFLDEMVRLGQGKKYTPIIETEISKLVREMEIIDKKRTNELERMLHQHK